MPPPQAGHGVVYGVREPGAAPPHEGAEVDSVSGAARAADVVVLATPWAAVSDALTAAGDLRGKPLLDVTNPIGPGFALALGHTASGAEKVASLAKNARVVEAFNTTGHENMAGERIGRCACRAQGIGCCRKNAQTASAASKSRGERPRLRNPNGGVPPGQACPPPSIS